MADTQNEIDSNDTLSSFTYQQKNLGDTAMEQAQRLVNQYRHLSVLGEQFTKTYNETLLSATPEVLTGLNDIIGGPTVRQYYAFLKKNSSDSVEQEQDEESRPETPHINGYLPSPEEDFVMPTESGVCSDGQTSFHSDPSLKPFFKQLMETHRKEIEKQNQILKQTLDHFQTSLQQQNDLRKTKSPQIKEALDNRQRKQIVLLNRLLEKLLHSQTDILVQTLQKFSQTSQNANEQQTRHILEILRKEVNQPSRYSDIIEEAIAKEPLSGEPSPEIPSLSSADSEKKE